MASLISRGRPGGETHVGGVTAGAAAVVAWLPPAVQIPLLARPQQTAGTVGVMLIGLAAVWSRK